MTADPFSPGTLGPLTVRNRFIKAATFEGMAVDNLVSDRLIDFHRTMAAGGLAEGAAVSAQIGHAGPVAAGTGHTGLAPSRIFSPLAMKFTKAVTDEDIERITGDFATAARLLQDAGFDAIEVHLGHNYLPSAFLSPALNKRKDRWGGSVSNRAAFPRQIVRSVREAVGPSMAVLAKLNMVDGYPGGIWLDDSIEAARLLESDVVAIGRALLREPALLNRWAKGDREESLCIHCNKCMPTIYQGTHCVLVAPEDRPGHRPQRST